MEGGDGFDSHTLPPSCAQFPRPTAQNEMARKTKRKRKKKTFSAATEVRRQARELQGAPPPTRVIQDKRSKPPKHKKRVVEEI